MYKIGEFSKIVSMSVKTLRYYHDIGLLIPPEIDGDNGYRYYNEASYRSAMLINTLKNFEFSINEILEIIDQIEDQSDINSYLKEKLELLNLKKLEIEKLQRKIMSAIENKEEFKMKEMKPITRKTIEPQKIASLRYKGKYDEMGKYIGELMRHVGGKAAGGPFALYYDETYMDGAADIEVCVYIKGDIDKPGISVRTLEGGEFLSLVHVGPYENLNTSYKEITDYTKQNNLKTVLPSREIYLKGPGMIFKGNPEKYETEILVMLQK